MKKAYIRNIKKSFVIKNVLIALGLIACISLIICSNIGIHMESQLTGWPIFYKISLPDRHFDIEQDAEIKFDYGHVQDIREISPNTFYAIYFYIVEGMNDTYNDNCYFSYERKFNSDFLSDPTYDMDPGPFPWPEGKYSYYEKFSVSFIEYPSNSGFLKCMFELSNESNEVTHFGEMWLEFTISNNRIKFTR